MRQTPVTFPSGKLSISGYFYLPDSTGKYPGVVLCHPHPLYGGSMSNSVIREVGKALVQQNIAALMFNFRGVGKSTGEYSDAIGEQDDIVAALDYISSQSEVDNSKLGLFGYSFGGLTGAPVACRDSRVKVMALLAPPLDPNDMDFLNTCSKPKYFAIGDADDMVLPETLKAVFNQSAEPKQFQSFAGVEHFWMGHEEKAAAAVVSFFKNEFEKM